MHRWSQLFIPTLREAPADAEVASHKFLVRAGYIRQLAAGIYNYLFLGQRSILKITNVVREEMDRIAQEFYLAAMHPREIWEASGRWSVMGDNMFRLKDRKGADLCLGMTEEEVMTEIARKELRSYKQLPQIWYQIQPKFRDEPRPKSGLLRVRQFTMKDAYSFDIDAAGLDVSYKKHYETYCRIFDRCGLQYVAVEAHSGAMGGSQSHEFMVYTDAGEDLVASCPQCGYAANLEKATSRADAVEDLLPSGDENPELIYTPGKGAIADIAEFLNISPKQDIKAVAYMAVVRTSQGTEPEGQGGPLRPVAVFLRGDHTVNEAKLVTLLNQALHEQGGASADLQIAELRPMHPEEVESFFKGPGGFIGPVGLNAGRAAMTGALTTVLDEALVGRKNMICGANKLDYHYKNVTPGKDFQYALSADVRNVNEGEGCPNCGTPLKLGKAVEIGHIFKLGYKYSDSMGLRVLDKDGKEVTPIMGSYGIGIERILTSIIEQNHDENGFWLPPNVAPFQVIVSATNVKDATLLNAAVEIAQRLESAGFEVLLDDRDERPGVKFKDADLIGVPFRITIGKKLSEGKVEVLTRSTRESQDATIAEIVDLLQKLVRSAEGKPRSHETVVGTAE
ncbi:MAG TPA: proline--tRNA ligase [Terriglobales bacterium]|nr:proline--tRNA ligase [Terriglobales bacterium]